MMPTLHAAGSWRRRPVTLGASGPFVSCNQSGHTLALVGLSAINLAETELNVRARVPVEPFSPVRAWSLVGFGSWLDVDGADELAGGAAVVPHFRFRYPQWGLGDLLISGEWAFERVAGLCNHWEQEEEAR
jgi:hypothetical protein